MAWVVGVTAPLAFAQDTAGPVTDADGAIANARRLVDPIKRCEPAPDGAIVVCGSDTERDRLTPELRAIAGIGQSTKDSIPHAEARAMSLDKLPYNWVSIGGRYPPGPEYNALYELAKERTDPANADASPSAEPAAAEQ